MGKSIFIFFSLASLFTGYDAVGGDPVIIDSRHYSTVFGESRNYRIFLPPGYFDNPHKRYAVIYFLHGWSQRYFGNSGEDDSGYAFDQGPDNKGDNIARFVSTHDVIVVRPDGYNRERREPYYLRPYNVGPVETFRQFPIYFPELVQYIDSHYNTIADRQHRGICGLSMGGYMTYWIAGKYPHMFSAAGNFCGSAEFVVGPKDFPVEFRLLDSYKNYNGMNLRLNYGDRDFIRDYHNDLINVWEQVMDNFEFKVYEGAHATSGLSDMLSFILKTFANPPSKPARWDHIDVYPDFSVWDYSVSSDRIVPGFTILENVGPRGFRSAVREFLPDGELFPFVRLSITTPPVYDKNAAYIINDADITTLKISQRTVLSDSEGRLTIGLNGGAHEVGINKKTDRPNICIASFEIANANWATSDTVVSVTVKLLNKGLSVARNVRAQLSGRKDATRVSQASCRYGNIGVNEIGSADVPFIFYVSTDSLQVVSFRLAVKDDNNAEWVEYFEIPIKDRAPELKEFEIADGKIFTVARSGTDEETITLGTGNGDGRANPGESIVILAKDRNRYWRTDLTFSDDYVNPFGVNRRRSDNWTDLDHVGASMKYDIALLSSDCPQDHKAEFFVQYYLPNYPFHHSRAGKVIVTVNGKDDTAPEIDRVMIPGDNVVQARITDGSKITFVKAKFISRDDPAKSFDAELKDDGKAGDRAGSDLVFSNDLGARGFGIYRVVIEAMDSFGNKAVKELADTYVLF
jgi:S-formylglutathione hydrolase FrmB